MFFHIIKETTVRGYPMRYKELTCAEVINTKNCHKLGCISDFIFDCKTGCIQKIIIPGPCHFMGFFPSASEYIIDYCKICKIGDDIILVDICEEEALCERPHHKLFC